MIRAAYLLAIALLLGACVPPAHNCVPTGRSEWQGITVVPIDSTGNMMVLDNGTLYEYRCDEGVRWL